MTEDQQPAAQQPAAQQPAATQQAPTQEVVKVDAAAPPAALMTQMTEQAGKGHANEIEDFAIPFLSILQSNSPQVLKNKPEYIEEAESSNIINTVTQELFDGDEGIKVIPVAFVKKYLEWKPRETDGGLVKIYDRKEGQKLELSCALNDKNQRVLPNGNLLVANNEHFVLVLGKDGKAYPAIIAMSSTQLKKSTRWNTIMQSVNIPGTNAKAPTFGMIFHLKSTPESNAKGDWFGWKLEKQTQDEKNPYHTFVQSEEVFNQAKEMSELISSGAYRTSDPSPEAAQESNAPSNQQTAQHM